MSSNEVATQRDILPLQWDQQKYSTGYAHIDEQHHELFDGINSLTLFLKNSSAADDTEQQSKVIELLYFLGEYVIKHFEDEEKVFEQCGHPMAAVNKAAHQAFIEKYFEYNDQLINGTFSLDLLLQLHSFLHAWLINHIIKIDTTLREYAEKSWVASSRSVIKRGIFAKFLDIFSKK